MTGKKYLSFIAITGFVASLVLTATAFAQTNVPHSFGRGGWGRGGPTHAQIPGVFGTVTAVSGTTITVAGKTRPNGVSGTTYTVDASNAQVTKNGAGSSVSNIAVGDSVMVQGTVSGSSVTATTIRDGVAQGLGMPKQKLRQNPAIQGNGQPVIGGSVTAINGTTLTVANKSNVTYAVDASGATITKMGTSTLLSSVATGDNVVVQGTVNGTSVTASSVIDQGNASNSPANSAPRARSGFFGSIGNFFAHLFGF